MQMKQSNFTNSLKSNNISLTIYNEVLMVFYVDSLKYLKFRGNIAVWASCVGFLILDFFKYTVPVIISRCWSTLGCPARFTQVGKVISDFLLYNSKGNFVHNFC